MATIHGNGLEDLKKNAIGRELVREAIFERYIVMQKDKSGNIRRTIYNKELSECFVC